jgi:hypothetical protein
MRYSKGAYEGEQSELHQAQDREQEIINNSGKASEAENFADLTYANVAGVLEFLRGNTAQQHQRKLEKLYELAHGEAIELENQHKSLENEAVRTWSSFVRAVERLKRFETEKLSRPGI